MKTYTVIIQESAQDAGSPPQFPVEHYKRRVELDDINAVIHRLDASLSVRPRKRRSDAGTSKAS